MKRHLFFTAMLFCCFALSVTAQEAVPDTVKIKKVRLPVRRFYVGSGMDGAIFSTADIKKGNVTTNGTIRFSYFANAGLTFNLNLGRHIGIYTGIDIKNIGFIEQVDAVIIKRRTYNVGIPIGLKIGNMATKRPYLFFGGGVDAPVNYREKSFTIRDQKTKLNEWFSDRTPQIMPYVFAGLAINRGVTLKVQYYLNNFLNPDFTKDGSQPYAGYDVHLEMFSIGIAVPLKRANAYTKMIPDKQAEKTEVPKDTKM